MRFVGTSAKRPSLFAFKWDRTVSDVSCEGTSEDFKLTRPRFVLLIGELELVHGGQVAELARPGIGVRVVHLPSARQGPEGPQKLTLTTFHSCSP